jgi:hypothetical protein
MEDEKLKLEQENKRLVDELEKSKILRKKAEKEFTEKKQRPILEEINEQSQINIAKSS